MRHTAPIRTRITNRTLHREQMPIRARETAGLLALVALVVLPVVFGLFQDNEYVRTSFATEALRKEKLLLQERYRRLRIERATLESLGRIEVEARKRGLVPPGEGCDVVFAPSSTRPDAAGLARAVPARPGSVAPRDDHGIGDNTHEPLTLASRRDDRAD